MNTAFRNGQRVRFHNGSRYEGQFATVEKVLPKNVDVLTDAGKRVRAHPSFLTTDLAAPSAPASGTLYEIALAEIPPAIGTLVRVKNDTRIVGYHVVIGEGTSQGQTVVKIAKLGGDGNRFWRVRPKMIEIVDPVGVMI